MQRSFLIMCLDDELAVILLIQHPQKIYNRYMETMKNHFNRLHPLHVRLHRLTMLHPASDDPEVFFTEFVKLMNEADTTTLSAETILLALMTTKCPREDLRADLLQHPTTAANALSKAQEYMSVRKKDINRVNAMAPPETQAITRQKPKQERKRCHRCNGKHDETLCWTLTKHCTQCGLTGHSPKSCKKGNTRKPNQHTNSKAGLANAAHSTGQGQGLLPFDL